MVAPNLMNNSRLFHHFMCKYLNLKCRWIDHAIMKGKFIKYLKESEFNFHQFRASKYFLYSMQKAASRKDKTVNWRKSKLMYFIMSR
jgi:hypothetical protein